MRFFALVLALASAPALAAPPCSIPGLPAIKGKSYHLARGMLIDAGFRPAMHQHSPEEMHAAMADLPPLGYNEVLDCSGTGFGACIFSWEKNGRPFSIITNGDPRRVARVSCE